MNSIRHMGAALGAAALLLLLWGAPPASAQGTPVGTAQNAIGTLLVVRSDGIEDRLQGKGALPLYEGDVLRTEAATQALIQFRDGVQVALNEGTAFKILSRWEKARGSRASSGLPRGVGDDREGLKQLEVETPVATAIVEGTEFNSGPGGRPERPHGDLGVVQFGTPFGTCPIRTGPSATAPAASVGLPAETNAQPAIA